MDRLIPPKPLLFEGNILENWNKWKQNFGFYLIATEYEGKSEQVRAALFLHCIGDEGRRIYNTLPFDAEGDSKKYTKVIEKFEAHISPRKNLTFNRYKFFTYRQVEGQSFDDYLTTMRKLCHDCELGDLEDDLLRDMLIIGLKSKSLQELLLSREQEKNTLALVIKTGQTAELTSQQAKYMQKKTSDINVDFIVKGKKKNPHYKPDSSTKKTTKTERIQNCPFCSYSHNRGACPAYSKTCNICNKRGHFSKCCKTKNKSKQNVREIKTVNKASGSESCDDSEYLFIGTIEDVMNDRLPVNEWTIKISTNDSDIVYKIDTGAQANVLPFSAYNKLTKKPKLLSTNVKLNAYNDTRIPVKGACILNLNYKDNNIPVPFIVADIDSSPVIGLKTSSQLNLVKRIEIIKNHNGIPQYLDKYSDCFGALGCFKQKHKIVTDPNVPPIINPPRRIPISIQNKLKAELDKMVEMKVIVRVDEPTDWVNSLVAVEKPDKSLRICLDPRNLNKAIKRPHYTQSTTEEILSKMSTGKKFTKLDASSAYWQICLDEDSSRLLTFNTPFGRYRYLRMAYGISSASDVCQMYIARMIEGIQGSMNSQDDIIIWGEDDKQLKERTLLVFEAIKKHGMKLNKSKCCFHQSKITFLGHIITSDGIYADDKKILAIRNMPYPTNVKELQRFLGSVNYLGKFIPHLSDHTDPLRKLLQNDVLWDFSSSHRNCMDKLKKLITQSPVLKFFDPNLPTKVSCDASSTGLGAVLEQKHEEHWFPVAYGSRSLTSSERNYCQLEKETLSIVFACQKFHEYVYGRYFHVYNDHMPLKSIFTKSITKAPPRIQRFLLRLQRYQFEMHYIKGSDLIVADNLSRAALSCSTPEINDEDLKCYVHAVVSTDLIGTDILELLQKETELDETLKLLVKYIHEGWPPRRNEVAVLALPYFNFRNDLTFYDGLVLSGSRIVVPFKMRNHMKKLLHSGHLGIVKTKSLAREALYWPGISAEIEDLIKTCELCQIHQNKLKREPSIDHDVPQNPWVKVGADCFELFNKSYLIIVDYATNYFDISMLSDKKSSTVATHTKRIFFQVWNS